MEFIGDLLVDVKRLWIKQWCKLLMSYSRSTIGWPLVNKGSRFLSSSYDAGKVHEENCYKIFF
jgi:hypothetical protein